MIDAPLTFSQWQHWEQLSASPGDLSTLYSHFEIEGRFEAAAFLEALGSVVRDHEALRVGLVEVGGGEPPRQWLRGIPAREALISLRMVPAESRDEFTRYVRGFLSKELQKPWQLADSYPFRMFLFKYSDDLHAFVGLFSHLAVDARGRSLFEGELWAHYAAAVQPGYRFPGPSRPIGFLEAASRRGNPHDYADAAGFWLSQASEIPPRLPARGGSVDDRQAEGAKATEVIELHGSDLTALRRQARQARSTEFQWILGSYGTAVAKLAAAETVKITLPVDTRRPDERDLIGMFATVLPIVVRPAGDPLETQARVRRGLADLLAHRDVPPRVVTEVLRAAARSAGAGWSHDVSIDYVREEPPAVALDGGPLTVRSDVYEPNVEYRNHGVGLTVSSTADRLSMKLTYSDASPLAGGRNGLGHELRNGLTGAKATA